MRLASLQDTLTNMASETGGRAILNATDFTPAFDRIAEDLGTYYSLGYSLPASVEGRVVNVKVKSGEGIDAVGREEAIAAQAICLIDKDKS